MNAVGSLGRTRGLTIWLGHDSGRRGSWKRETNGLSRSPLGYRVTVEEKRGERARDPLISDEAASAEVEDEGIKIVDDEKRDGSLRSLKCGR